VPNLDATNITSGTLSSNRISGSYTGITGVGALGVGSISSGFGNINIGTSTFTGNGSGLTTLNASNLTSGTVGKTRLPNDTYYVSFLTLGTNAIALSLDSNLTAYRAANGNVSFTGSNYTEGVSATIAIQCDGTSRTLTFPAGWKFVSFKPTSIAANKIGILSLTCFTTAEAGVVVSYGEQI
jgi:hypothetical protein